MAKITINYPDKHVELLILLLEKTNGDLDLIFRETSARFIRSNLDLLTEEELNKFDSILFHKPQKSIKKSESPIMQVHKKDNLVLVGV
ncbi:MAG: hypothetical protein U5L45_09060 [Saprospiraceae bacterium]|nr:hypothetical protein [Saprospiraceae bacterium]